MRTLATALIAAAFAALALTSAVAAQGDLDCYQFASWNDAQATYQSELANPGWDWMYLDEDGDGIACECLYYGYHCWTPWD